MGTVAHFEYCSADRAMQAVACGHPCVGYTTSLTQHQGKKLNSCFQAAGVRDELEIMKNVNYGSRSPLARILTQGGFT